jgi:hypothetical protein
MPRTIALVLTALLFGPLAWLPAAEHQVAKPNMLFIITD